MAAIDKTIPLTRLVFACSLRASEQEYLLAIYHYSNVNFFLLLFFSCGTLVVFTFFGLVYLVNCCTYACKRFIISSRVGVSDLDQLFFSLAFETETETETQRESWYPFFGAT